MKAIVIDGYGGVDQLHLRELPDPRPQADEVLVRVRAAGINPVDWKIRQGQLRFILRPKFPFVPGGDIAGDVVFPREGRACTRRIERFGDIVAHPILSGLHCR